MSRQNCLRSTEDGRDKIDSTFSKADALFHMGEIERKYRKYQTALERFQQSLRVAIDRKDKFRQEKNLGSLE